MDIDANNFVWEDISKKKPKSRLLTTLVIGGTDHRLEAVEVEMRYGAQCAVDPTWNHMLRTYSMITEADGPFGTVQIEDRTYVLIMTPFAIEEAPLADSESPRFFMQYNHCGQEWQKVGHRLCCNPCPNCAHETEPYVHLELTEQLP